MQLACGLSADWASLTIEAQISHEVNEPGTVVSLLSVDRDDFGLAGPHGSGFFMHDGLRLIPSGVGGQVGFNSVFSILGDELAVYCKFNCTGVIRAWLTVRHQYNASIDHVFAAI